MSPMKMSELRRINMRGRPQMQPEDRRIKMVVRVRPSFKAEFSALAQQRGLTTSDAQREAMRVWAKIKQQP